MNEFYKKLIEQTEIQKAKDQEGKKRESALLEIKDERVIPKLKVKFKKRLRRRFKSNG